MLVYVVLLFFFFIVYYFLFCYFINILIAVNTNAAKITWKKRCIIRFYTLRIRHTVCVRFQSCYLNKNLKISARRPTSTEQSCSSMCIYVKLYLAKEQIAAHNKCSAPRCVYISNVWLREKKKKTHTVFRLAYDGFNVCMFTYCEDKS